MVVPRLAKEYVSSVRLVEGVKVVEEEVVKVMVKEVKVVVDTVVKVMVEEVVKSIVLW